MTLVVETGEVYWGTGTHEGNLKRHATGGPDDILTFSFEDLRSIVTDLEYTQSTMGDYNPETETWMSNRRHSLKLLCKCFLCTPRVYANDQKDA